MWCSAAQGELKLVEARAPNQGPHANTVGDTDVIRGRRIMFLPPQDAHRFLLEAPRGTITKALFHQRFVQPGLGDADAGVQAIWTHVAQWFRLACTLAGGGANAVQVTPGTLATPAAQFAASAWYGTPPIAMTSTCAPEWEAPSSRPMPSTPESLTCRLL